MGRVKVTIDGEQVERELARASILGRHPMCTILVSEPSVPAFWFEVRYRNEAWMVRSLGPKGMHVQHAPGTTWSRWEPGASGCLQCADGAVSVELCDDGAPRPFAIELRSNTEIVAQQFESLLFDLREDQRERLVDYGVEVVSYRAYRFFEVG